MYTHRKDGAQLGVGVNYGLLGDNLPAPDATIGLLKSRNITKARIFDPNPDVLRALEGSNIELVLGVRNEDLQQLASDKNAATSWVANNVVPHFPAVKFRYITAGNESALQFHMRVMGAAFPPSSGAFLDSELEVMGSIVSFLSKNRSPLLANVYPYYTYTNDPVHVRLDYALGTSQHKVVADGLNQYTILLDAMVDAMYAALEKMGGQDVRIVVSESGWPSAGNGDIATLANAQTYVNNLIAHVSSGLGTPRRPGSAMETYVFALFNEDLKPSGTEQNFGLFHPDMTEVYPVSFA
uniref:glucan endo-1,3-beta-D-glucosidase n=1 Tax=Fagus sylvatica TaxID=28930 RepID=A0A2N9GCN6_FAGSY